MSAITIDHHSMAQTQLSAAKQSGDLASLIMGGVTNLDSWLIESRLLPGLQDQHFKMLRFTLAGDERRSAALVPLADGSAFALSSSGTWLALEATEAQAEIVYIGTRFAPGNHWQDGFEATLEQYGQSALPVTPLEVAAIWLRITGVALDGFEEGFLDQIEALGLDVINKVFSTQGRLGL